jgi:hypothetical protein
MRGSDQVGAVHRTELERFGQHAHRLGAGRRAPSTFEVAYPSRAEPGAFGEVILAQSGLEAVAAQELPEASRRDRIHAALLCVREGVRPPGIPASIIAFDRFAS